MLTYPKRIIQTLTGTGGGADCPFDIDSSATESVLNITFPNGGTVNNSLPSNIDATLSASLSVDNYIVCVVTTNTNRVTSSVMAISATLPEPPTNLLNAAPTTVNVLIGVVKNGRAVKTWGCKGITMTPVEAFRTPKATPAPFEAKYDIYYTWAIS